MLSWQGRHQPPYHRPRDVKLWQVISFPEFNGRKRPNPVVKVPKVPASTARKDDFKHQSWEVADESAQFEDESEEVEWSREHRGEKKTKNRMCPGV